MIERIENSGDIIFKIMNDNTNELPNNSIEVGTQIFAKPPYSNTMIPLWWNGQNWVDATGKTVAYSITYNVTNIGPRHHWIKWLEPDVIYYETLVADDGYSLPASIEVSMGGVVLSNPDYTYNSSNGNVAIRGAGDSGVSGNVVITAAGVPNS